MKENKKNRKKEKRKERKTWKKRRLKKGSDRLGSEKVRKGETLSRTQRRRMTDLRETDLPARGWGWGCGMGVWAIWRVGVEE